VCAAGSTVVSFLFSFHRRVLVDSPFLCGVRAE
jgi:hypothetical protein